ncbi:SIMPL domain-containing protein [Lysobacter firmicutimachus]|uniref:SIMPL domain-containing protein n=1 Tax=Lysobacter firmicutimachus TaxID=1792846 RepID=A0AAU8MXM3_9GAMM|nr:SIMPL domain-containing protein [Lysobacter antibioticus]
MIRRHLLAIALLASLSSPVSAETQPRSVDVSASAEIKVVPDVILLDVGVESRHARLDQAKRSNDDNVAQALAFLKRSGVPDKDVQTDFISIEPSYHSGYSLTTPQVYIVRKSIGIKLTRIGELENVLTGLLSSGVQYIHGIEFRTTQLRKHRDAARALAIQAAKEKADAMAAELGVRRGPVLNVSESYAGGWWRSGSRWGGGMSGGQMMQNVMQNNAGGGESGDSETLSVGQISVTASVSTRFAIE